MKIQTHEDIQKHLSMEQCIRLEASRVTRVLPPEATPDNIQGQVDAYVNHGRWIAECPHGCGEAYVTSKQDPLFWCAGCRNTLNGGRWYLVAFPKALARIERALEKRLARTNMNWTPGETSQALEAENKAHGVI